MPEASCAAANAMAFDVRQPCERHAAAAKESLHIQSNDLLCQVLTCLLASGFAYRCTAPTEILHAQLHEVCSQVNQPKTTTAALSLYTSLQLPAVLLHG